jgi:glucose/arabinose dehydrogenase
MRNSVLKTLLALLCLCVGLSFALAQEELPRCGERDFLTEYPRVISYLWCIERPLEAGDAGEWAYTSLAYTVDGQFYARRPHTGELLRLVDSDADNLPDTVEIAASGMRFPNGLAADGNSLYILGDGIIYRYENGELSTLVDDLPHGRGFLMSAIAVYQERLYIGIPFPCDFCEADNELYGTILSMDLQGENRQVIARGLRYPTALLIKPDTVWVTDTARDNLPSGIYDEINRFALGEAIPHFGFPYCIGLNNAPDGESDFDCSTAQAPAWGFANGSSPFSLVSYEAETFPWLQGEILVSLAGSFDNSEIHGYSLFALHEMDAEEAEIEVIVPTDKFITLQQVYASSGRTISIPSSDLINQRGAGFWPHRVYDVVISPEAWIYLSVGGEGIYVLRPADYSNEEICQQWRECD